MEVLKTSEKILLYEKIAYNIECQINNEVYKTGEKLPSIRTICREYGVSMSTALQAYYELENKSLIESRPQSGYFVSHPVHKLAIAPETSNPTNMVSSDKAEFIISEVYKDFDKHKVTLFSLSVPDDALLPIPKLNKALLQATRTLKGSGTEYEQVQGNPRLRNAIARWSFKVDSNMTGEDLITTAGCMNALSYCLMALTERGDTVALESPVYFGILQLTKSLGLKVLEMPTNATTGIELEALKKAFEAQKVKVCLLVTNFNNPLGSSMPDSHKRELVKMLEHYNIPLIEDDLYGDVYFGHSRPTSCKTYDESGLVLWCGSVSKTLAPGYRVGWVAPGKHKEQIIRLKLFHSVSSTTITQEAIADFLENGRYDNHLRKLRNTLHTNSLRFIHSIVTHFPEGTKISQPEGGFVLWVELDKRIDTFELYKSAILHKISIAPGRMFTLQHQFDHCLRLSYGLIWTEEVDKALQLLGMLIKEMY